MSDIAKMIAIAKRFGGGSGPSEVVILPETVTEAVEEMDGQAPITTPLSATPTEGATAKVTYNGTEYPCTVAYFEQEGLSAFLLGNIDQMGAPVAGGNPDAPFVVALSPAGVEGMYGFVLPMDGATTVTISIVQTEGAASGGESAGGGYLYFTGTATMNSNTNNGEATLDKSFDKVLAAIKGKTPVFCALSGVNDGTIYILQAVASWNDVMVSLSGTMTGTSVELTMTKDGTNSVILR